MVDGLQETGFVTREAHPNDRRAVQVTLTAQGLTTAEAFAEGRARLGHRLFADLPPRQLDQFVGRVTEIVARLREDGA